MKKIIYTLLSLFAYTSVFAATIVVKDADLEGGQTYNWTSDNTYILDGFVFLEDGGILNIEAGTVIKGQAEPSTDDLASTLIITRGAKIFANGTAENPIIFTAEFDAVATYNTRKQWGGLVVLGKATITDEADEKRIEGFPDGEDRALYGGNDDADNSGVIRYVSIRHGGAEVAEGDEINGLTMGGVGSGTVVDYVEVLANSDDGIEFFGGTVSLKHAVVAFCGDDGIDWDTGWRGYGQYWLVVCGEDKADNAGEHDGAKPDDNTPPSNPIIYNATFIGSGVGNATADLKNEHAILFRDGTAGTYANSIFTDFTNYGLQVEDRASGLDSRQRMENGELVLKNNIWFGFGEGNNMDAGDNGFIQPTDDAEDMNAEFLVNHLTSNANTNVDPQLGGISRVNDGGLNPYPSWGGPAYEDVASVPNNDFHNQTNYRGAFGNGNRWILGWTGLEHYDVLDVDGIEDATFVEAPESVSNITAIPNPATGFTNIVFDLNEATTISLRAYDVSGKVVATLYNDVRLNSGQHTAEWNVSDLPNGMYYYTLQSGQNLVTKKVIVNN